MEPIPYSLKEFEIREKAVDVASWRNASSFNLSIAEWARALCTIRGLRTGLVPLVNIIAKKNQELEQGRVALSAARKEIERHRFVLQEKNAMLAKLRSDESNGRAIIAEIKKIFSKKFVLAEETIRCLEKAIDEKNALNHRLRRRLEDADKRVVALAESMKRLEPV